jgi:hypothetical protein
MRRNTADNLPANECRQTDLNKFNNLDNHLKIMAIRLTERALPLFWGQAEISSSTACFRSVGARELVEVTVFCFVNQAGHIPLW